MSSNYGAKKTFGKQKTYGKAVKSHLNGWFGRSLWNELENSSGANSKRNEPVPDEDALTEESASVKKDKAAPAPTKKASKKPIDVVIAVEDEDEEEEEEAAVVVKGSSSNALDDIVNQLDDLGITEDARPPSRSPPLSPPPSEPIVIVERRTSVVVAQDLHSQSSVGSLRESSDKENESGTSTATATPTTVSSTLQKLAEPEQEPYSGSTPRSVLGERDSLSVKESPPRKRGLKKRVSASTAGAPSPLRTESFTREELSKDVVEDSIIVWEDEANDRMGIPERKFAIIIEGGATKKATTPKATTPKASTPKASTPKSSTSRNEIPETPAHNYAERGSTVVAGDEPPLAMASNLKTEIPETPTKDSTDDSIIVRGSVSSPASAEATDSSVSCTDDALVQALYGDEITETDVLLGLCTEQKVLEFDQYIDSLLEDSSIRKLGEASYSEVFLQSRTDSNSTTVLKIIPFGQEEQCEVKSIIQEVRISKTMAQIDGFIGFRGAYVVQGYFPEPLMDEWDNFDMERGSENVRPDFYEDHQLFAVILLENGGSDLEHTELQSWEEALDVFWQAANALASGEEKHLFEHRDLHWGNLVIDRREVEPRKKSFSANPETLLEGLSLEDKESTLKVSLIDYTLSRARCTDDENDIEFMPLNDTALFGGKGDYQFDIYRFMRKEVSSGLVPPEEECIDWNVYAPRTNIFWLHYLTNILLTRMGIPRPAARGRNAASQTEKDCFRQLEIVAKAIDPRKKKFGKGPAITSAGDLVGWAKAEKYI